MSSSGTVWMQSGSGSAWPLTSRRCRWGLAILYTVSNQNRQGLEVGDSELEKQRCVVVEQLELCDHHVYMHVKSTAGCTYHRACSVSIRAAESVHLSVIALSL